MRHWVKTDLPALEFRRFLRRELFPLAALPLKDMAVRNEKT